MTEPLQFDKVEYTGAVAGTGCTECGQTLVGQYYAASGAVICGACKDTLEAARMGGSRLGRFAKAGALGFLTAALGTAIWYGVRALTGYEFGLLAILVGLGVGGAVRVGSNRRGGWAYQALAMLLTYASIVSTYVPDILKALDQPMPAESTQTAAPASASATPASAPPVNAAPAGAEAPEAAAEGPVQALAGLALALLFLTALAFAAPFLGGFENIMGIIIIGIGLYEAWKINRVAPLVITGPYRLAPKGPTTRD